MNKDNSLKLGKYLVSPLTRKLGDGGFASSISIRSGTGSATTDRIFRFVRTFHSDAAAVAYALAEGRQWVRAAAFA